MVRKLSIFLPLCALVASGAPSSAWAVPPPLPMLVPDHAQDAVQTQLALQQAQAQANAAESQARLQARLNATQARFEAQVATQEQAQLAQARQGTATALPQPVLPTGVPLQEPVRGPLGTIELARITPKLGQYFGTDHGVLVVRAPAHGVLSLQDGDVILSIGGRTPSSSSQAARILTSYDPGQKMRLVIMREHRRINITTAMPGPPARR